MIKLQPHIQEIKANVDDSKTGIVKGQRYNVVGTISKKVEKKSGETKVIDLIIIATKSGRYVELWPSQCVFCP